MTMSGRESAATTTTTTAVAAPRRLRLDSLDGLRACAAFGVFLFHVNLLMPVPHTSTLLVMGSCGVSFFFVLSGYVLTWSSAERLIRGGKRQ